MTKLTKFRITMLSYLLKNKQLLLVTVINKGFVFHPMSNSSFIPPKTQRALVLQGGGALGAYEVGVIKVLYEKLIEGKGNGKKEGLLFDIVDGTSIGAMNAAVLISNIVNRNKTWKEAVQELENFWTDEE